MFWFTEGTMLFVMAHTPMTLDKLKSSAEIVKRTIGNNKVCLLAEVSNVTPLSPEMMDYIAPQLLPMFNAIAVISKSQLATLVANTFLHFKKLPFPIKLFTNDAEAYEWLSHVKTMSV